VELPAVAITWWDLQNKQLPETVLSSRAIEISASGTVTSNPTGELGASSQKQWIYIGMVFIALISFIGFFHRNFRPQWNAWRQERIASEKAFFRRFVKATRSGQPTDALNALMHWLARINTRDQAARLDQFLTIYSDPAVVKEADRLNQAIEFKTHAHWHGRELKKGITMARQKWLVQQRQRITSHQRLPQLNP